MDADESCFCICVHLRLYLMQCVNCQFHNMPGAAACGRCSSPMGLATVAIDVNPPRASAMAKRVRTITGGRRTLPSVRDAWALRRAEFRPYTDQMPPGGVLARMVVPGWPQWYAGQRWQGHLFFWSCLVLLLLGLLGTGTTIGGILLGLAFSVHSWSVVDVLNQTFTDRTVSKQMARSIGASVVLWLLVYWPAMRLIGTVVSPFTLNYAATPFNINDTLLGSTWLDPRPGRVVLYDIALTSIARGYHRESFIAGRQIDRVLGAAGDVVAMKNGRWFVNGKPSPWRPLNGTGKLSDFEYKVPDDYMLVFPSTAGSVMTAEQMAKSCLVPRNQLVAVIYAQIRPLSKLSLLH